MKTIREIIQPTDKNTFEVSGSYPINVRSSVEFTEGKPLPEPPVTYNITTGRLEVDVSSLVSLAKQQERERIMEIIKGIYISEVVISGQKYLGGHKPFERPFPPYPDYVNGFDDALDKIIRLIKNTS